MKRRAGELEVTLFNASKCSKNYGLDTWFGLGDKDLATHLYRTERLKQGATLSQITDEVCDVLGLKVKILPMTNDKFETRVRTSDGLNAF